MDALVHPMVDNSQFTTIAALLADPNYHSGPLADAERLRAHPGCRGSEWVVLARLEKLQQLDSDYGPRRYALTLRGQAYMKQKKWDSAREAFNWPRRQQSQGLPTLC